MTHDGHVIDTITMMKNGSQHTTNAPVMIANVLAALRSRFASSVSLRVRTCTCGFTAAAAAAGRADGAAWIWCRVVETADGRWATDDAVVAGVARVTTGFADIVGSGGTPVGEPFGGDCWATCCETVTISNGAAGIYNAEIMSIRQ